VRSAGDSRNRLRIPLQRHVAGLDPYDAGAILELHLVRQIFSTLTEYDKESQRLVPALAHYWESENDGKVWHFWLRPGVRFHDGSELEPEDVRQTLLRMRDTKGHFQGLYRHLRSVEVGNGRRVTCHLGSTDYLWPHCLASANASIVPRERRSDFSSMPIGSGPFKLVRRSEYRLTLEAFDDYYRERALLDEIDLWVISQAESTGEFDVHFGAACAGSDTRNTMAQVLTGCAFLVCNATRPILRTAAQRLALANWLAPAVTIGSSNASWRPASGLLPTWDHRAAVPGRRPRIAGLTSLTLVMIGDNNKMALANAIKERLSAAHITLNVISLTCDEFAQKDWLDSADLVLCNEALEDDTDLGCYEWFSGDNMFRQWMPAARQRIIDEQLQTTRAMADAAARMAQYEAIGRSIAQEGWAIPIAHDVRHVQIESHVSGARENTFGLVSFAELWVR
jgi:SgrR family transcriptional regulator